jgi:hypothetical protein
MYVGSGFHPDLQILRFSRISQVPPNVANWSN